MKRYGLKEEESMHISLEKRGTHACESDRGRKNINIITEKKSCNTQHMSIHGDDNERPQHAAAFDLANLFLCSHFLFLYPFRSLTLAAASPFNFYRTPMSSRRLPVSRLTERQEKNRQCTILLSSLFRGMLDSGLVCIFLFPL